MTRKLILLLLSILTTSSLLSFLSFYFILLNIEKNEQANKEYIINNISTQINLSINLLDKLLIQKRSDFIELHQLAKEFLLDPINKPHDLSELLKILEKKAGIPIEIHIIDSGLKIVETTFSPDLGLDFSEPPFQEMKNYLKKVRQTEQIAIGQPDIEFISKKVKIFSMSVLDESRYLELGFIDPDINGYFKNLHKYVSSRNEPQINLFVMFWNNILIPMTFVQEKNTNSKVTQYEEKILKNKNDILAFENVVTNNAPYQRIVTDENETTNFYLQLASLSNPFIEKYSTRYLAKIAFSNRQVRLFEEELEHFLLLSLIFSMTLIIASALYIRHWLVSPLDSIHSAIKQKSFVEIKSPLIDTRELVEIAHTYNETLDHLNSNIEQLEHLSNKEALTGLDNRRKFTQSFEKEVLREKRHQLYFALAMIDVDNFKQYNDILGHQYGDKLLVNLAEHIKNRFLRPSDHHCRMGGDEFSILLVDINPSSIISVFEDLQQTWNDKDNSDSNHSTVSLSIGIYVFSSTTSPSWKDAYEKADAALYKAKDKGRNLIEMIQEPS